MRYDVGKLQADVMARLGEVDRPRSLSEVTDIPWPEDIVAMKAVAMLGEVGTRLIKDASVESLGNGVAVSCGEIAVLEMPCGLYGAEVRLPDGFLRLASVKMSGWRCGVCLTALPDSGEWSRQWSAEPGIAGCPARPRAYLDSDGAGCLLRLVGSESEEDALEWLTGWCVPAPDEEGCFDFPEVLYHHLVGAITEKLG